jgi:glycosyltransferase involved in cell wall biosynthesis
MACGKPVVASKAGGGPLEIVEDGVTGFLVNPNDPGEVAQAVHKLALDPDLRKQFGEAGRRKAVSQYDSRIQAKKIEDIYNQLLTV